MRLLRLHFLFGLTALTVLALHAPAAGAPADEPVHFSLEAASQPRAQRPELEKVKQRAKANGVSLGAQLRSEFGRLPKVSDSDYPDAEVDGIDAMRFADFELMAKEKGLPLEKIVDEYGWEDQFTVLARYIAERYPRTNAGYAIREVDGVRRGWVAFEGEVPADVVAQAKKVPAPIDFEANKGYSGEDVQAAVDEKAADLAEKGGSYAVSADPYTGEVEVDTAPDVEDHDGWLRGGGYLDRGFGSQCTAGFNIEKDGVYSPMTAGHCVPVGQVGSWYMIYQLHGGDGSSTTNVYSKLRHVGAYGDFSRFGPGTMSATDTFYEDWSTKRYVTSVMPLSELYAGRALCKFGTVTGRGCTAIRKHGITVTTAAGTASRLMMMETEITDGGDSGGPWFSGGAAAGITKGGMWEGEGRRDLVSLVSLVPSALNGWTVRVH
ncbi:hypothetical protein EDD29_4845 [Actinocorallia herbida]|uniref:Streptogrisin C n=1 Tax=Actinocorallia herbida TaxID=58109 RepID=A0A3N1D167_9ACTN|nr:S1 family peptidase [Actinocorallia herbida]ROO87251.1 hypothetical protein EDD29_4845 [Actinocorallia herbida]